MDEQFRPDLRARVSTDADGTVRHVLHTDERWLPSEQNPRRAAIEYVRAQAALFEVTDADMGRLHEAVNFVDPRPEGASYRLEDEKRQFDSTTVAFAQTYLNVPVWRTGITVTVKEGPSRVVESTNTTLAGVSAEMPSEDAIDRWRRLLDLGQRRQAAVGEEAPAAAAPDRMIRDALGLTTQRARADAEVKAAMRDAPRLRIHRGRFFVYRYDPALRQAEPATEPTPSTGISASALREGGEVDAESAGASESGGLALTLPLPPVPDSIKPGRDYLVAEVTFTLPLAGFTTLNWRGLFEVETNAVLYLRALIADVNGLVFRRDPITKTGVLTNTAASTNATLNPLRDDEELKNLIVPAMGPQALSGSRILVSDDQLPTIAPPTQAVGNDFDYDARTNNFAAVSAYYHPEELFAAIEDLGFTLSTYFNGTAFPIHVDHRACGGTGLEINAFCSGDAQGDGIGLVGYCLADTGDTANPLGRAVDRYVHWHEIGGHGILWDHVDSPNFGFAHSAGDGLAGIQNDPESVLRQNGLVERFRYAPFRPIRWMNRDVAAGWGWGGTNDTGMGNFGYDSEQILATSHFRAYRSIGGDSTNLGRREFASKVMTYLIVRAVGDLTPATNPSNYNPATMTNEPGRGALLWCNRLMATDLLDWTSEGIAGGAYNKVIRWAFERQGLFQPPAAPTPVTTPGAPPAVDVYIDDGRAGEYPFQQVHWNNTSIWNRNAADGMTGHQHAIEGATNYAYVKVKNRGTTAATNVTVKGYHSLPGAGLTWPVDFTAMTPAAGHVAASVPANSSGEVVLGPFEWVPNENAYGHDCVLMIASVAGDPSNVDNFGPGETIAEWRLVPNDNNVGQRNVQLVAGGGGSEGLMASLHDHVFWAGNTFNRRATMSLEHRLPPILADAGWSLRFRGITGNRFVLAPGERREIVIELVPGRDFTQGDVGGTEDRDISVELAADGMLLGGMTYRLDPFLKEPPQPAGPGRDCRRPARDLLDCLDLPGGKVRSVRVRKITVDICMDADDC
jgi:zinc metalloprotease ZmpB